VTPPFVFHRKLWCPFFPAYPSIWDMYRTKSGLL
jgi:hypothetical protein